MLYEVITECGKLIQDFFRVRRAKDTRSRRGTEVVVTGSTRNRLVPLKAGHVGSNPTLSANNFNKLCHFPCQVRCNFKRLNFVVITSYSIHYTKLYESGRRRSGSGPSGSPADCRWPSTRRWKTAAGRTGSAGGPWRSLENGSGPPGGPEI